ncbi:MAG: hypothetical protein D6701_08300 [Gemmatimonadetes bacterium]|nr:MAG: hypothetical protein D6701_08300 [Gemmatimonadota bacterium]
MLDLIGLVLFLAGGGVFARAWLGFRSVPAFERQSGDDLWAAIRYADSFVRWQHVGAGLMAAGVAVFVAAWLAVRRDVNAPAAPNDPEG